MRDLFLSEGNTTFELAERRREVASKTLQLALATEEIVKMLNECDMMIKLWSDARAQYIDNPTDEHRDILEESQLLAIQARKDKMVGEAALVTLMKSTDGLGLCE